MEIWMHVVALIGGFVAGCINLLAGNGSAITLTILTEVMGLPPNIANATNRIGVMSNSIFGLGAFARKGKWELSGTWGFMGICFVGGVVGVYLATVVSNEQFRDFFKFMMVFMLFVVLFKPDRWVREAAMTRKIHPVITVPVYFLIGVYGGFIQMGMGIFFLVVMVFFARFPVIKANMAKMLVVLGFTAFSLIAFAWKGYLNWEYGIMLAVGQGLGAWFMANYAARSEKAGLVAYRLLIAGLVLALIKLFDLHLYVIALF